MGYHHGLCYTRVYRIRKYMLKRCNNPNHKDYKSYGGRGIKVCNEWANNTDGAKNFYKWAYENGYTDDLTLDRIDVNGDYEPKNCRWIPRKRQEWNKRSLQNKTGYAGVGVERSGRYFAVIGQDHKQKRLGTFATAEEASDAYKKAKSNRDILLSFPEGVR